jgi:Zn-dependent peptidase ImmA (M78 family)
MTDAIVSTNPQTAAELVLRSRWDGTLPVPVGDLAKSMGVLVAARAGPFSGRFLSSSQSPRGIPTIEFNHGDSFNRQRFALAHELGHFAMGHANTPEDGPESFREGVDDPKERDANRFAMELLMPAPTVRSSILRGQASTVDQLASMFGVGTLAMARRLDGIGMLL